MKKFKLKNIKNFGENPFKLFFKKRFKKNRKAHIFFRKTYKVQIKRAFLSDFKKESVYKLSKKSKFSLNIIDFASFRPSISFFDKTRGKAITFKSDFGKKLFLKEKFKLVYGNLPEKQLRDLCKKSLRVKFHSFAFFFKLLESRLDIFIFRLNIFNSIMEVKQFIKYGRILVNGKRIYSYNYMLNNFDVISFCSLYKKNLYKRFIRNLKSELFLYKRKYFKLLIQRKLKNFPIYILPNFKLFSFMFVKDLINERTVVLNSDIQASFILGSFKYF